MPITLSSQQHEIVFDTFDAFLSGLSLVDSAEFLRITSIKVENVSISEEFIPRLSEFTNLKDIFLLNNGLEMAEIMNLATILSELKFLENLTIKNNNLNPNKVAALAAPLSKANQLKILSLSHNNIDDEGIVKLTLALYESKSLEILNISDNSFTEKGVKSLASCVANNPALTKTRFSTHPVNSDIIEATQNDVLSAATLASLETTKKTKPRLPPELFQYLLEEHIAPTPLPEFKVTAAVASGKNKNPKTKE